MKFKLLTIGLLISGLAVPALSAEQTTKIRVDGMTCPFCSATSEKALQKIDGVKSVTTDLEAGVITVCASDTAKLDDVTLKELFLKKGFTFVSKEQFDTCKEA